MRFLKVKIAVAVFSAVFLFFFSNDFGLIDVEKTAIITAVALDLSENGEYKVTAQIAVPEATDTNTENKRAQVSGTGATVGGAIKKIGDLSGWFPQLAFCNLIIIGNGFENYNVIRVIDYFSRTLRIQDSALIVFTDEKAEDVLKLSTPLDNISSFAIQKIILKNAGLNNDVAHCDIKSFCVDYYSEHAASVMPLIRVTSQSAENEQGSAEELQNGGSGGSSGGGSGGSSGGGSGGAKGDAIFNANRSALFSCGIKAGELDETQTLAYNTLTDETEFSTFEVKNADERGGNYLLTVFSATSSVKLEVTDGVTAVISLDVYAKVSDENNETSDLDYAKNIPLPYSVKLKAEEFFRNAITELLETEKRTECDFLKLKRELYRKYNSRYREFENVFFDRLNYRVRVTVSGQK